MQKPNHEIVHLGRGDWLGLVALSVTTVATLLVPCLTMYAAMDARVSKLEASERDHEVRITRREAVGFTAEQASELSTAVTKMAAEMIGVQQSIRRVEERLDR